MAIKAAEKYPEGCILTPKIRPFVTLSKLENGELILVGGEHQKPAKAMIWQALSIAQRFCQPDVYGRKYPLPLSTQDCRLWTASLCRGYTSDTPNLYVATGYGKWGMTNGTAAAMILRDLIVQGESPWQNAYDPSRQTAAASAKNFFLENFDVAKHLLSGKLEGKLTSLPKETEVKPGEGKAINAGGKRTGAFKDLNGVLHLVNTTCTHMGCELNWNSAEESWDCPCHGSRFTYDGDIIEGPAVQPLAPENDPNPIEKLLKEDF